MRPASEIIDTSQFFFYLVDGGFELRINREEYLWEIESSLLSDKNCYYDYQYWELKKNPGQNDLNKIAHKKFSYLLDNYIYYELTEKRIAIWDSTASTYISCFFMRDYDDIGTSGKEIYVVRPNKIQEDPILSEGFQEKWVIAKKATRIY